jgi:hypothetical protein
MFVALKKYKELEEKYKTLEMARIPVNHEERIAELEIKMAKLWNLLLEKSLKGEDKLTKFGRRFGGTNKSFLHN